MPLYEGLNGVRAASPFGEVSVSSEDLDRAAVKAMQTIFEVIPKEAHTVSVTQCVFERMNRLLDDLKVSL